MYKSSNTGHISAHFSYVLVGYLNNDKGSNISRWFTCVWQNKQWCKKIFMFGLVLTIQSASLVVLLMPHLIPIPLTISKSQLSLLDFLIDFTVVYTSFYNQYFQRYKWDMFCFFNMITLHHFIIENSCQDE